MNSHIPVLTNQVLKFLDPAGGKIFIDCTLGFGGHAETLLQAMAGKGVLYGIEVDDRNLAIAMRRLANYPNAHFIRDNFENLERIAAEIIEKEGGIDGILFDLGLSSLHVDEAARGFSFQRQGPLDMRFDTRQKLTAKDIVNTYSLEDLINIFKTYGEERRSYKIAQKIVEHRRHRHFETTSELADFISAIFAQGKRFYFKRHPATRVFQALRIAVNREIEALNAGLASAVKVLSRGGRLAVISYHSIEDRIVKNLFRDCKKQGILNILTKKPVCPVREEIQANRRARSAKLRAAEKL